MQHHTLNIGSVHRALHNVNVLARRCALVVEVKAFLHLRQQNNNEKYTVSVYISLILNLNSRGHRHHHPRIKVCDKLGIGKQ